MIIHLLEGDIRPREGGISHLEGGNDASSPRRLYHASRLYHLLEILYNLIESRCHLLDAFYVIEA